MTLKCQLSAVEIYPGLSFVLGTSSILAAAKGPIFLCIKIDCNLNKQSHAVLQGVHCGDISSICSYRKNSWISCSVSGSIAIISLEEPELL